MEEYLSAIGMTEEEQREKELLPEARRRLATGVVLSQIAEDEGIVVSDEEITGRVQELKSRYASDPKMQAELNKPENQREISNQLLTEKTVARIIALQ
jgi:FKBP-type peptidyl-prolyl cis-trans isomerase (trigger factor)